MSARNDIAQIVTDQIIAALEKGVAPWVRPWGATSGPVAGGMPRNAATGHAYRGINIFLLWLAASEGGFSSDLWITAKQTEERRGRVKDGSIPTRIVLAMPRVKVVGRDEETGEDVTRRTVMLREFWVYNLDQVEGVDAKRLKFKPAAAPAVQDPAARRADVDAFIAATGAKVLHGGSSASYSPSADEIRMPAFETFRTASDYYATALHELTHWTGHSSRDGRFKQVVARFGDNAYAAEELVAEMGAAILCADLGVEGQLQHAAYIGTWLKVLRGDKHAVFTAATKAQKALDWLNASAAEETAERAA